MNKFDQEILPELMLTTLLLFLGFVPAHILYLCGLLCRLSEAERQQL